MNIVAGNWVGIIAVLWNIIGSFICTPIYALISVAFQLILTIPKIDILDLETIQPIYQRITMVLIIVMAFYITFQVVKYVVQPDTISDKEKGAGNILMRFVIVIILIAFVPKIFSLGYTLQQKIIDTNLISKVILGSSNSDDKTSGSDLAADMLSLFYGVNDEVCPNDDKNSECEFAQEVVNENLSVLREGGYYGVINPINLLGNASVLGAATHVFTTFDLALNASAYMTVKVDGVEKTGTAIKFNWIFALITGVIILWILFVYAFELGKRYFQLIFLQITAPIAIIGYISPKKDGIFQQWLKQCIATYLDLFIRLGIIYIVVFLISKLGDAFIDNLTLNSIYKASDGNLIVVAFVYIILVIGLLLFAKKAPELIKELFPSSKTAAAGNFGISGKETIGAIKQVVDASSRTIGGTAGGIIGIRGALTSEVLKKSDNKSDRLLAAAKAGFAGAKAGFSKGGGFSKGSSAARTAVQKAEDIVIGKGTVFGTTFSFGTAERKALEHERIINKFDKYNKDKEQITASADEVKYVKQLKEAWKSATSGGKSAIEIEDARKAYKKAQKAVLLGKTEYDASTGTTYMLDAAGTRMFSIDAEDQENVNDTQGFLQKRIQETKADTSSKVKMKNFDGTDIEIETAVKDLVIEIERLNPATGLPEKVNVAVEDLSDEEFAANLGTIETAIKAHMNKIRRTRTYESTDAEAKAAEKK